MSNGLGTVTTTDHPQHCSHQHVDRSEHRHMKARGATLMPLQPITAAQAFCKPPTRDGGCQCHCSPSEPSTVTSLRTSSKKGYHLRGRTSWSMGFESGGRVARGALRLSRTNSNKVAVRSSTNADGSSNVAGGSSNVGKQRHCEPAEQGGFEVSALPAKALRHR